MNEDGDAPLHMVCREEGQEAGVSGVDVTRLLLEAGADVRAVGQSGRTVLFWPSRRNDADTIRLLLSKGAKARQQVCVTVTERHNQVTVVHTFTVTVQSNRG